MNSFFNKANLPKSEIYEYGLFLRNVLISNIEERIQQKHIEFKNLSSASQKIKLLSRQSNSSNDLSRMLLSFKEDILKINYSELIIQVEIALAQIEIIENFSRRKQVNIQSCQALNEPISLQSKIEADCSNNLFLTLNTSQKNEQEGNKLQDSKVKNNSSPSEIIMIESENEEEKIINENHNNSIKEINPIQNEQLWKNTFVVKNEPIASNFIQIRVSPQIFSNIPKISQLEEEIVSIKEDQYCNIEIKSEFSESKERSQQEYLPNERKRNERPRKVIPKEEHYTHYLKKLVDFEKKNDITITSFFKNKELFFERFRMKRVPILNRLIIEDKLLIQNIYAKVGSQVRIANLLELPRRLVSRVMAC